MRFHHPFPSRVSPRSGSRAARALVATLALAVGTTAWLPDAGANERHFTNTYESGVLPQGAKEIEVWTTARVGRERFYSRFDQRLEFEVGLTDRLQTSLYLNFSALNAEILDMDGVAVRRQSMSFGGVSSEWKLKLTDPVANALGSAIYAEVTAAPDEVELEAKAIFDKQIGDVTLAANLVGEYELDMGAPGEVEKEIVAEIDLAAGYRLRPGLLLGLELRNHNEIAEGEWEHSSLFLGPVFAYATKSWWVALSLTPQLPALKGHQGHSGVDLHAHERLEARLLFSFHLD